MPGSDAFLSMFCMAKQPQSDRKATNMWPKTLSSYLRYIMPECSVLLNVTNDCSMFAMRFSCSNSFPSLSLELRFAERGDDPVRVPELNLLSVSASVLFPEDDEPAQ